MKCRVPGASLPSRQCAEVSFTSTERALQGQLPLKVRTSLPVLSHHKQTCRAALSIGTEGEEEERKHSVIGPADLLCIKGWKSCSSWALRGMNSGAAALSCWGLRDCAAPFKADA